MTDAVVHFEIIGTDPVRLREYYGELFGWEYEVGDTVSGQVSEPGNYGFVDGSTTGAPGLNGDQQALIIEHLKECPHCTREFNLLEQLSHETLPARSPPPTNGKSALTHNSILPGKLRQIAATLLTPSAQPLAGAYGALRGPSQASHYAYHAENLQLTLGIQRVVSRTDRRVIHGALELDDELYEVFSGATAHLSHNETLIRTAELDELGNFVLDDLAPGTYRLALRLPDREVIVEALSL